MNYSSLVLAFIGDSVFELKIREYFLQQNILKVNDLQSKCSNFASAKGHMEIVGYLLDNDLLTHEELIVFKRGRNAKVNQRRKNFDSKAYHASTGFEALIGYLHLNGDESRIDEIISLIMDKFD